MTTKMIAIHPDENEAKKLADSLAIEWSTDRSTTHDYDYAIMYVDSALTLVPLRSHLLQPFCIDFQSQKIARRVQEAGLKNELVARAIGIHPKKHPIIIDATAGLGRDSFILASLGFEVTSLERSRILYAMLDNALKRAEQDETLTPIIKRMHLIHTDAHDYLKQLTQKPDVIYLDPMFPDRSKTAKVKKEMVLLQDILEEESDASTLLTLALSCAAKRVVVKRPRLAPALSEKKPNFSYTGKSARFDIYLVTKT